MVIRAAARGTRLTGLDGLRAVAVGMVMAYHGGIPGLRVAGFYGVDVFFVLSGFLITTLLLDEQAGSGSIRFGSFWGRRARRLLPALLVMLVAVDLYVAYIAPKGRYPTFRDDGLSVIAYFSNWHFIAASSDYFAATGFPSLLTHTWSLAIEEQFYAIWPLVIWGAVRMARRLRRTPAGVVAILASAGALTSAAWMAALYRSGAAPSRLYYGTDTHAQSILIGAALAGVMALSPSVLDRLGRPALVLAAAAGLLWAATDLGYADAVTYQGGFLMVGLLSAVIIAGVLARPSAIPARVLSLPPLVYVGRISYGMYLWYFPLFAVLDHARTGLTGAGLFALRCGADVAVAAISFRLIEQPVRRWRPQGRSIRVRLASVAIGTAAIGGVATLVLADTPAAFSAGSLPTGPAPSGGVPPGTGGGLRVLVVGDSTGAVLGFDLAFASGPSAHLMTIDDRAIFGCGLVVSAAMDEHGVEEKPPAPCNTSTPASGQWPALLRADLASSRPDVVLVAAGRWEVQNRRATPTGPWTDISQPADASYVKAQLELAASIAISAGVRVGLATAPCFSSGEQPSGAPWPEDDPKRVSVYNALVRSVVAENAAKASLVDLNAMVCPGGRYTDRIDGFPVRAPDGIHYPYYTFSGGAPDTIAQVTAFGSWIAPQIRAALRP